MRKTMEINYEFTYIQTDHLEDNGDVKAIAYIDAFPVTDGEEEAEGYVVGQVLLSTHNDLLVAWTRPEGRLNPKVLGLVEQAKTALEAYRKEK